jgi:HpcH/HpaI aldolase/citrate lyase family
VTTPQHWPASPAGTADASVAESTRAGLAGTAGASVAGAARASPAGSAGPGLAETAGAELDALLAAADRALAAGYPGERPSRQPVHTVYVPADTYQPGLPARWGSQALDALAQWAPDPADFAVAMGLPPGLAADVLPRVRAKLAAEPVEDLRLDFEDGYGDRGDQAEDADAASAAAALAAAVAAGSAPPFTGLRCKSLEPGTRRRAIRTLDIFLAELLRGGLLHRGTRHGGMPHGGAMRDGQLPSGFAVTLPKVTSAAQVSAMARLCDRLEEAHGMAPGQLVFEVQVETPQVILGADGTAVIARCVHAAAGRLIGLHYGTYDYSAALGIAAAYQSMEHPVADHARAVMQVAVAGTGVRLSDGSTNVLPGGGRDEAVAAWRLHSRLVRRSLERGFYQGWDLHPGHLASRYAATYGFFREGLPLACARLRGYLGRTAGGLLEEPATARALAGYLARGLDCGAVSAAEVAALAGLDRPGLDALRGAGLAGAGPAASGRAGPPASGGAGRPASGGAGPPASGCADPAASGGARRDDHD